MSDKLWEWCSTPSYKQIGKHWEVLGSEQREAARHVSVWALNSPSVLFSFTPLPFFQQPCWQTEPLHQPIRQQRFEAARGAERPLVIFLLLSTRSLVPFQASAPLSRQDYIQSHDQCWDLKTLVKGQHHEAPNSMGEEDSGRKRQRQLSEESNIMRHRRFSYITLVIYSIWCCKWHILFLFGWVVNVNGIMCSC